jgi:hypothetical protein
MKWGEVQSVIQLAVALNTIYLSLKDIRSPTVRNEQDALNRTGDRLRRLRETVTSVHNNPDYLLILRKFTDLSISFRERLEIFEMSDRYTRFWCLFIIVLYTALLVVSAYLYNKSIDELFSHSTDREIMIAMICVIGFVPISWGLATNIRLIGDLKRTTTVKRQEIDGDLVTFETRLNETSERDRKLPSGG